MSILSASVDHAVAVWRDCPVFKRRRTVSADCLMWIRSEAGRFAYFVLSHFVCWILSFGCETSKCHRTPWNVSECGVTFWIHRGDDAAGVGNVAVYPPSLLTFPRIEAPISFAYCSADTIFGLTFFSRCPPPTEKTITPSSV
jgi:hypothetical protein